MPINGKTLRLLLFLTGVAIALPAGAQVSQTSPVSTPSSTAQSPTATPSPEPPLKFSMNALVDTAYTFNFTNDAHGMDGSGNLGYFPSNQGDYAYALNMAELAF